MPATVRDVAAVHPAEGALPLSVRQSNPVEPLRAYSGFLQADPKLKQCWILHHSDKETPEVNVPVRSEVRPGIWSIIRAHPLNQYFVPDGAQPKLLHALHHAKEVFADEKCVILKKTLGNGSAPWAAGCDDGVTPKPGPNLGPIMCTTHSK